MEVGLIIIWVALISYIAGSLTAFIISSAREEKRRKRLLSKQSKPTKEETEDIALSNGIEIREIKKDPP